VPPGALGFGDVVQDIDVSVFVEMLTVRGPRVMQSLATTSQFDQQNATELREIPS
jgi:hypothetical protein